jgi:23S rRNA (adenine2503-C2)-methyltransferase
MTTLMDGAQRALAAQLLPQFHDEPAEQVVTDVELDPTKKQLKDMSLEQIGAALVELGEKPFRAEQIFQWMYVRQATSFDQMTNISKELRGKLKESAALFRLKPHQQFRSADGTTKLTFLCHDGAVIESVWIPNEDRNTLCVSSQVGCAMACSFCLTAKMGLVRNLSVGEIVDQIVHARRIFETDDSRLTNIVMMGMGEPLHNYENLIRALGIMTHDDGHGLSSRRITVSTAGLAPRIPRLGHDSKVNLAVSLNATTDEVRTRIMPINKRYDIAALLDACRAFPLPERRRITFEYVMLAGVNDTMDDAKRLVTLLHGFRCKVNLIPFNAHPRSPYQRPSDDVVERFRQYLVGKKMSVFVRTARGDDISAACGMLGVEADKVVPLPKKRRAEAAAPEA